MKLELHKATRRQKQKEETRSIILDTARSLFSEIGFTDTTIRKIAEKAGVGFGTVFNHFPDKSSLLIAALLDDLAKTQSDAMDSFPSDSSACKKFLYLSKQFYLYYAKNPDLSRTLIKEMWFVKGEWGKILKEQADQYLLLITEIINQGKANGEIKEDVVSEIAAASFFSHYFSVLLLGLNDEAFKPDELVILLEMLIDQTMIGIGTEFQTN
ncbi:MAG: TetR/AcrR family transcriptional regulator [Desulfobacteraceae bacterium]|nr:TetR/AcrR family transcriptional regulator [Desulfobacteraceae bacterium]